MIAKVLDVLREGYEGPSAEKSYYLDSGPDAGLRNTLARLTPEEASQPWGGNSVAAHAAHLLFSFDAFGAYAVGDTTPRDWDESWRVSEVGALEWKKLREDLDRRFADLEKKIEKRAATNEDAIGIALGAASHLAYHVGAIRQKILALRTT